MDTLSKLGLFQTMLIGFSYTKSMLFPTSPRNRWRVLDQSFRARVLPDLFQILHGEGLGCSVHQISAEWGAQRVKGLSITQGDHPLGEADAAAKKQATSAQKDTETSLIEQFMYPKLGPGQLWEVTPRLFKKRAGSHDRMERDAHHAEGRIRRWMRCMRQSGERRHV